MPWVGPAGTEPKGRPPMSEYCARCGHDGSLHFDGHAESAGPCGHLSAPSIYDPSNKVPCNCPNFEEQPSPTSEGDR